MPSGKLRKSYHYKLLSNPVVGIYFLSAGNLPNGLSLDLNGDISGQATTPGTSRFLVTGVNVGGICDTELSITIIDQLEPFLARFYHAILGRDADRDGLLHWRGQLAAGDIDGAVVARSFVFSPEFQGLHATNAQFLGVLHAAFLDRAIDPDSLAYWSAQLNNGVMREDILWELLDSPEFRGFCTASEIDAIGPESLQLLNVRRFVRRFYKLSLEREGDAEGIAFWQDGLVGGSLSGANLARNFFLSPEFLNRDLSNDGFVVALYRTLLAREPDASGRTFWSDRIDSGVPRSEVLTGFANSHEFRDLCAQYGITPFFYRG